MLQKALMRDEKEKSLRKYGKGIQRRLGMDEKGSGVTVIKS